MSLELRFRAHIIDLIVQYLLSRTQATMLTTQTVQRTPYGQLTRKRDGSLKLTPKQAHLVPLVGGDTFLLETRRDTFAIGDGKRYRSSTFAPSRGGGVPSLPLPHQPVTHEGCPEFRPLMVGLNPVPVTTWVAWPKPSGDDGGGDGGPIDT